MKSRLTIEIDFEDGNKPVIEMKYESSDDVRDKLIKAFMEGLSSQSTWCRAMFYGSTLKIWPLSHLELGEHSKLMALVAKENTKTPA
jgi:hypothetical protein